MRAYMRVCGRVCGRVRIRVRARIRACTRVGVCCGLTVFVVVMVVSTRRGMLVAAMVLVVVCDTDLHSVWGACIVIAINHGTTRKEPRDEHHGD